MGRRPGGQEQEEEKTVTMKMKGCLEKHRQECDPSPTDETIHGKFGEVKAGNVDGQKDGKEAGKTTHKEDGNQHGTEDGRTTRGATGRPTSPTSTIRTPRFGRGGGRSCCGRRTNSVPGGSGGSES